MPFGLVYFPLVLTILEVRTWLSPLAKRKSLVLDTQLDKWDLPEIVNLLQSSPYLGKLLIKPVPSYNSESEPPHFFFSLLYFTIPISYHFCLIYLTFKISNFKLRSLYCFYHTKDHLQMLCLCSPEDLSKLS
ncbi:hypothetical protein CFP56_041511 [Quercus suber]|uniref:Uncharacterized protein n=1 Tax=Quercus suber TaxID=58331 RepID=A0AAW0IVR3_QUESU